MHFRTFPNKRRTCSGLVLTELAVNKQPAAVTKNTSHGLDGSAGQSQTMRRKQRPRSRSRPGSNGVIDAHRLGHRAGTANRTERSAAPGEAACLIKNTESLQQLWPGPKWNHRAKRGSEESHRPGGSQDTLSRRRPTANVSTSLKLQPAVPLIRALTMTGL